MKEMGMKLLMIAGFIGVYILGCGAISAVFPESTLPYIVWAIVEYKMFQTMSLT